jgi:hypothetical protein
LLHIMFSIWYYLSFLIKVKLMGKLLKSSVYVFFNRMEKMYKE